MKLYKKMFKEYFKKILDYKGYSIFDIQHSVERYKKRVSKDISLYNELLEKGIDWIINNKKEIIEDRYIFVSKKYKFGIQVHWRKGRNLQEGFNGYSATTLSQDEMKFFKEKDKQIFLEQFMLTESKQRSEDIYNKGYARYKFVENLQKEMDLCGFDLFVQSGKIYYTFELIEL